LFLYAELFFVFCGPFSLETLMRQRFEAKIPPCKVFSQNDSQKSRKGPENLNSFPVLQKMIPRGAFAFFLTLHENAEKTNRFDARPQNKRFPPFRRWAAEGFRFGKWKKSCISVKLWKEFEEAKKEGAYGGAARTGGGPFGTGAGLCGTVAVSAAEAVVSALCASFALYAEVGGVLAPRVGDARRVS
jgi:hypothetical protein